MKVGFYCESPADRAALEIFTQQILGEPLEPINMDLEAHSVPAFFKTLDGVFRGVHYNSDAEGLVVVVDNDDAEVHAPAHEAPEGSKEQCRFCQIRKILSQAQRQLKARQGRLELKIAIGVPVPAIEAWYLAGKNHQVGEAAWNAGQRPFSRRQLKKLVYGTDRPSLELETRIAVEEAQRIAADRKAIETAFPVGFGLMAQAIRSWKG